MQVTLFLDLTQEPDREMMRLWLETRADDPRRAVAVAEAERDVWKARAERAELRAALPVAPEPGDDFPDPKRFWNDADQAEAWRLYEAGMRPAEVARQLRRDRQQVYNYLWRVENGKAPVPTPAAAETSPEPCTALATVATPALPARMAEGFDGTERGEIAIDPAMRAKWRAEMDEAERMKAVAGRAP
jgi:hypothetical protein